MEQPEIEKNAFCPLPLPRPGRKEAGWERKGTANAGILSIPI